MFAIMALLNIVKYGEQILEQTAGPIRQIDDQVHQLASDMLTTMHAASGVGLAAPQVGAGKRLIVVDLSEFKKPRDCHILINPEIISSSGSVRDAEGCLSFPDMTVRVIRPERVVVRAESLDGKRIEIEAEDLLARALCHEIDHLNGILFINRMQTLRRNLFLRRIRRLRQAGKW